MHYPALDHPEKNKENEKIKILRQCIILCEAILKINDRDRILKCK